MIGFGTIAFVCFMGSVLCTSLAAAWCEEEQRQDRQFHREVIGFAVGALMFAAAFFCTLYHAAESMQ